MQPKTSSDLPLTPPKHDEQRDRQRAAVKDADKSDEASRETIHGDGDTLDLDKP